MKFFLPVSMALWLGILTSISPCPLATNITAISFISYRIAHRRIILLSGIFYTIGRSITYSILGFLIVKAVVNIPLLSNFLQKYINKIFGPFLIIVGMYLLDLLKINLFSIAPSEKLQNKLENAGIAGSFLLGALFALAFCPISAALFFGGLIPLAIKTELEGILLPFFYGIGTGLPVLIFAFLIAISTQYIDKVFHKITKIEVYAKGVTGVIFILAGIYYILAYIFEVI